MEVDHPIREAIQKDAGDDAHPPREDDEVGPGRADDLGQLGVAFCALASAHSDDRRIDPGRLGALQRGRLVFGRHDEHDGHIRVGIGMELVQDALEVRTGAGDQYGNSVFVRQG